MTQKLMNDPERLACEALADRVGSAKCQQSETALRADGAIAKGFPEIQCLLNAQGFWFRGRSDGDAILAELLMTLSCESPSAAA